MAVSSLLACLQLQLHAGPIRHHLMLVLRPLGRALSLPHKDFPTLAEDAKAHSFAEPRHTVCLPGCWAQTPWPWCQQDEQHLTATLLRSCWLAFAVLSALTLGGGMHAPAAWLGSAPADGLTAGALLERPQVLAGSTLLLSRLCWERAAGGCDQTTGYGICGSSPRLLVSVLHCRTLGRALLHRVRCPVLTTSVACSCLP